MSRRTGAGLVALGLIAVLVTLAATRPVDYVTFRPGPTMNVLGTYDGKTIINVDGHKSYRDDGGLRMVTVYPSNPDSNLSLFEMVRGWADPDTAVLPRDAVYGKDETEKSVHDEAAVQMSSSQDNATAAALAALDVGFRSEVAVGEVSKDGAAAGTLKKGDVILAVDGRPVSDPAKLIATIRAITPGTQTRLTIRRNGTKQDVTITTKADPKEKSASRIGIEIQPKFVFPFKVKVQLPESVGGPSAGMMFALGIYDVLTPGSLTGGKEIAGSGEITSAGVVGPIGGIGQKLPAAQRDGARLFLVARENCAEAVRSHYDPDKMRLVKVHTLEEAIKDVEAWRDNPDVTLPRCSR
jgi:PDZ domain-containing protein